jgi:hypothetical protein
LVLLSALLAAVLIATNWTKPRADAAAGGSGEKDSIFFNTDGGMT